MVNTLVDNIISVVGIVLFVSDLLLPLWLWGIVFYLRKKKWEMWKAWGVASAFCLAQAYIVAMVIGESLVGYILIMFGSLPYTLFYDPPPNTLISENLVRFHITLEYYITPAITIIILPTLMLFVVSKLMKRNELAGST